VLGQLGCAGDVVSVGMGFKRPAQLQAVFLEHMQITLELLIHRVNDQGFARNVSRRGCRCRCWRPDQKAGLDSWCGAFKDSARLHRKGKGKLGAQGLLWRQSVMGRLKLSTHRLPDH